MLLFRQVCFHSKVLSPQAGACRRVITSSILSGFHYETCFVPRRLSRDENVFFFFPVVLCASSPVTCISRSPLLVTKPAEAPEEEAVPKPYAGNPGCINGIYAPLTARLLNPGLAPIFNLLLIHTNVDSSKLFLLNLAAFKLSCRISSGERENHKPWTTFIPGLRQG